MATNRLSYRVIDVTDVNNMKVGAAVALAPSVAIAGGVATYSLAVTKGYYAI